MASEEGKQSPTKSTDAPKQADRIGNGQKVESMLSPRFRSVAAMAGWDEEALLIASLVVEDTPDRDSKRKKRSESLFKTPPTNSRRKRRGQRRSPVSIPATVLNLDEDETIAKQESETKNPESEIAVNEEKKVEEEDEKSSAQSSGVSSSGIQCLDRLREELSCAICLEICFEPSTTPCGHSFCKKCLRSAADKCGKRCPKCRQLISNGRCCTVNTVLWNTIQLLFPKEVEARKESCGEESKKRDDLNVRMRRRRRVQQIQDEDAALAFTLQRQEFMAAFRAEGSSAVPVPVPLARQNLRAMASRAINLRIRRPPT